MSHSANSATPRAVAELADKPDVEAARRRSNRQAIANLLRDRSWHTTRELLQAGGTGYSARVHELRNAGWDILSEPARKGEWRYHAVTVGGTKHATHVLSSGALQVLYRTLEAADDLEEGLGDAIVETLPKTWQDELFADDATQRLQPHRDARVSSRAAEAKP